MFGGTEVGQCRTGWLAEHDRARTRPLEMLQTESPCGRRPVGVNVTSAVCWSAVSLWRSRSGSAERRCAMGDRVEASALVVGHDAEVHRRLERCVAALQRMVDGGWFVAHEDTIGMEVELDLVDPLGRPRLVNDAVLARMGR